MAPCFDRVVTSLCTEAPHHLIDWEENAGSSNGNRKESDNRGRKPILRVIPVEDDEFVRLLMQKEDCSMKEFRGYVDSYQRDNTAMRLRAQIINWILNVNVYFGFRSQTAFLSVIYFDRFLSKHSDSRGKPWLPQLVAVGSISLAAKLQEIEVPLLLDLQVGDVEHVFESRTIQRMELLIMSTLDWKMSYVTPFSYLHYLLQKVGFCNGNSEALIERSEELILYSCRDLRYLSYSPSGVAVASLVWACREEDPSHAGHLQQFLKSMWPVKEIEAAEWSHLMGELVQQDTSQRSPLDESASQKSFVPLSPMAVLDAACFSSDSCDQTFNTIRTAVCASMNVSVRASAFSSTCPRTCLSHKNLNWESNQLGEPFSTSLPPQVPGKRKSICSEQSTDVQNKHLWRALSRS